jgi:hypothetical protein
MLCEKVEEHGGLTDDDLADIDDLENPAKRDLGKYRDSRGDQLWGPARDDGNYGDFIDDDYDYDDYDYDDDYDDDDYDDDYDDEQERGESYARYVDKLVNDVLTDVEDINSPEVDEDLRLLAKTKKQIIQIEHMLERDKRAGLDTERLEKRLKNLKRKYNGFLHGLL